MRTRGRHSPVRVGTLLTSAVPALAERMLEETIRREWETTVGPEAARRSRPQALRQGTLEVAVDNSPWLQELTLRGAIIAAALAERHGPAVTAVRFVMGVARGAAPGGVDRRDDSTTRRRATPRRLTDEEHRLVEAAAQRVADPEVASSLRHLLTRDLLARGERRAPAASEQP
jgi:Dna[CI] antecedent DciA-like protein